LYHCEISLDRWVRGGSFPHELRGLLTTCERIKVVINLGIERKRYLRKYL
jgi:hypothetical protein